MVLVCGVMARMQRIHLRTLELIFSYPARGNLTWRNIVALFVVLGAEISEKGQGLAVVLPSFLIKVGCEFINLTRSQPPAKINI